MITVPLDEAYLTWLYAQVESVRLHSPTRSHWRLFRQLYKKEFLWLIPNDDNRVEDGRDLRYEFLAEVGHEPGDVDQDWLGLGCSFLEMLIGLSRQLAFVAEGKPHEWFWTMLHTLGLDIYADNMEIPENDVEDVLDTVIWRTYRRDGKGGLFPLKHAHHNQRDVEIWYQLNEYLLEND